MTALAPEQAGLFAGLIFSVAVLAFKTAVGKFHYLANASKPGRGWRFLILASSGYLVLFVAAFALIEYVPLFQLAAENRGAFELGMMLHLALAAGLVVWGAGLLASRSGDHGARGWWLLAIPCPVCASAVLLACAFGLSLLPEEKWTVRAAVPALFFLTDFAVLGILALAARRFRFDTRRVAGFLMIFVGLYFAGILLLAPNFDRIEAMYKVVAGAGDTGISWSWPVAAVIFLPAAAGFLYQLWRNKRCNCSI